MKIFLPFLFTLCLFTHGLSGQSVLELGPSQSMSIAGKGPGQDAAINPYLGSTSIGIIENIGANEFTIRVQYKGEVVKLIPIEPAETKEVDLPKGYELYFDSRKKATAKVDFKKAP